MDFAKLFNLKYIFVSEPAPFHPLPNRMVLVLLIMLVLGLVVSWIVKRFKKNNLVLARAWSKFLNFFFTLALFGWFLYFCRQQGVYFLSRRFWFFLWLLGLLVWLVFILKYALFQASREKRVLDERKIFEKYLPRTKKLRQ